MAGFLFINMEKYIYYLKNHLFIILTFILLIVFIPVVLYAQFGIKNKPSDTPVINPNPTPITSSFDQSYNSFNQLVPGKSDLSDVEKINGPAYKSSKDGNKLYLYYKTPSNDYENTALLRNGVLYYSLENVFGDYRGKYSDYINTYGQPSLHLYNTDSTSSEWYIFLQQGIGLEIGGEDVSRVLHFVPQPKEDFIKNFTSELNLTSTAPDQELLEPIEVILEP